MHSETSQCQKQFFKILSSHKQQTDLHSHISRIGVLPMDQRLSKFY